MLDRFLLFISRLSKSFRLASLKKANDEAEQPDGAGENLDDEDLDEEGGIVGVGQGGPAACDSDTNAAEHVGKANSEARPEDCVACEVVAVGELVAKQTHLLGKHNRQNDAVDGHSLTEHNAAWKKNN